MSELSNIIEIFGFIDREVVAEPELTQQVAGLLPAYGQGAAGWDQATSDLVPLAAGETAGSEARRRSRPTGPDGFGGRRRGAPASADDATVPAGAEPGAPVDR